MISSIPSRFLRNFAALAAASSAVGCGGERVRPTYVEGSPPRELSAWGQLDLASSELRLAAGVEPYALNTALFSDYAGKLRTIWTPDGTSAAYDESDVFDFPVGTVITKTFYYLENADGSVSPADPEAPAHLGLDLISVRLMETRVLVRREAGWEAIPYVWNAEETEAVLKPTGAVAPLTLVAGGERTDFAYLVPNRNQCAGCHMTNATTRALSPIGPKARHLNRDLEYADGPENQIARLVRAGVLDGAPTPETAPRAAVWTDASEPLEARARAYLDINCAHCHSDVGPADTSGLDLSHDAPLDRSFGLCKLPIAAAQGTGGRKVDIAPGDPDASILVYRMESTNPAEMMPELGRATTHAEGVDLIRAWVAALQGACA